MRHLILLTAVMYSLIGVAQTAPKSNNKSADPRQEARIEAHVAREKAREARTADFVKHIDSLILSHSFTFNPTTFQMQPAGMSHIIYNPNFQVAIYPDFVDIYLPYFKGITPPYFLTVINYTITYPQNYIAVQTDEGWTISFKSSLFSVNTYTFTFHVYSSTGMATLDISSDIYNTVTYQGSLIGHY